MQIGSSVDPLCLPTAVRPAAFRVIASTAGSILTDGIIAPCEQPETAMSGHPLDPNQFDQKTVTNLCRQAKTALRKRLGSVRRALPVAAAAERSSRIVGQLRQHAWLGSAQGV